MEMPKFPAAEVPLPARLVARVSGSRVLLRAQKEEARRGAGLPCARVRVGSELRPARDTRVRDRVADVAESADVDEQALEAEAEAGVRDRPVAAQIPVPAVVLRHEVHLAHARVE